MNWIRELSLVGTKGSGRLKTTTDKVKGLLENNPPEKVIDELLGNVKTSTDAIMGLTQVITPLVISNIKETKKVEPALMKKLVELSLQLHKRLLRGQNKSKIRLGLKLFNKILDNMPQESQSALLKLLKDVLDKKETFSANWVLAVLGSRKSTTPEINQARFKALQNLFITEKPDASGSWGFVLPSSAFRRISFEELGTNVLESFKSIYKRNSANIGRVLEFLKMIGPGYFRKMPFEQLKEYLNPKIFEGLSNKTEDVAIAAANTVLFFVSLNRTDVNDHLAQSCFSVIGQKNIEQLKYKGLQICFGMKLDNPATTQKLYELLLSCLEGIKNEELKAKIYAKVSLEGEAWAKRVSSGLQGLNTLLEAKGSELSTSTRMILAKFVLQVNSQKEGFKNEAKSIKGSVESVYSSFVSKTLVDNPNRLRGSNLETLSAILLVSKFHKLTGLCEEAYKKIAEAIENRDLDYYNESFMKNNAPIFKGTLFEVFATLQDSIDLSLQMYDIVLGSLVMDPETSISLVIKPYKLSQKFILSCLRGVKVLQEVRESRADIRGFWRHIVSHVMDEKEKLSADNAHILVDSICTQIKNDSILDQFCEQITNNANRKVFESLNTYPRDMENPIDHHYLGCHGLFSRFLDKQNYYHSYARVLITVDTGFIFDHSMMFFNDTELQSLRLLQSRNSMVHNRNLEVIDSWKNNYRETLELLDYLKKEKKSKKKTEDHGSQVRSIAEDYRIAGDLELRLLKEETAYAEYSFYLKRLSDSAADSFWTIFKADNDSTLQLMERLYSSNLFYRLRGICRNIEALHQSVQSLVISILKGLTLKLSDKSFGDRFSQLYFDVISTERASQLIRLMEDSLAVLYKVKEDPNIHPALVPIICDFCQKCFESLYDAEARRKSFDVIIKMSEIVPSHFLYEFIRDHLDDLYFNDTKAILNEQLKLHGGADSLLLSGILLKILDYQEGAQKIFLQALIELDPTVLTTQTIGNFEKIKLLIITKGENTENATLATEVLAKIGHKLEYNNIINLDFKRMVTEIPFDLHQVAGKIIAEALQGLSESQTSEFLKKLLESCSQNSNDSIQKVKAHDEDPNNEAKFVDISATEETLGIYPVVLSCLASQWPVSLFEQFYDVIISLENNYLPEYTEKLCSVGISFIHEHKKHAKKLLEIFEARIKQREGIVTPLVFLGAAAKLLSKSEAKLDLVTDKIVGLTESTDPVFQNKLGRYISRLLIFFDKPDEVIQSILTKVTEEKEPIRIRAKCYSVAGMIRGLGVKFVEKFGIFDKVNKIIKSSDKKDLKDVPKHQRYFVVYILAALWEYFGKVFEPKFPEILPCLMKLFGDTVEELRDLSTNVLNIAMKKLSGYGVKSILPYLIEGCNDTNTRSKLSNLTALGSIAYCASKQLASSLPEIVPKLTQATIDTNPNIKEASIKSLNQLLATIKTPEIVHIREILINALSRPYDENGRALEILLNTEFHHLFDTPSIALVMPIIIYGLKNNRDNKQREDAAKVVANVSQLIKDPEDLSVYLVSLTEALIMALSDILSEVRATTAKAVGRLVIKLGIQHSEHLIQSLRKAIEGEKTPSIERAGCAQALSEALYSFGMDQVERNMPAIVEGALDKRDHIREGFLAMFVYLPMILDNKYERYISETLNAAIDSIAHQNENIRNLAIKAVKTIILKFSGQNMNQILKSLFDGMFSDNGLKRNSSVVLLGDVIDVLFKDHGNNKDKIFNQNQSIFSALYIVKNDENPDVKISTNNIWKSFVDNTKVVLKNIYPILTRQLVDLLISGAKYHDEISKSCIDVFIGKYGDTFIGEIMELFKGDIQQNNPKILKGICLYLIEAFNKFNPLHLNASRKRTFESVLLLLLAHKDEQVWATSVEAIYHYYKLAKEDEFIKEQLSTYAEDLSTSSEDSDEFEKMVKVIIKITLLGIPKINHFVETLLFTEKMKPWQLEVVSNTASIFSQKMYIKGTLRTGLNYFADQYVELYKTEEKGELMLYTIKHLVERLSEANEGMLVTQVIEYLKRYIIDPEQNYSLGKLSFEVLSQFYEFNCVDSNEYLSNLLENIIPILSDTSSHSRKVFDSLGMFLKTKLTVLSPMECAKTIEILKYSLSSLLSDGMKEVPGLAVEEIFDSIFYIVSNSIIVGDKKICGLGLDALDVLLKASPVDAIQQNSNRVLGVLLRACNYRHEDITKAKVMSKISLLISRISLNAAQESQIASLIVNLYNDKHEDSSYESELERLSNSLALRSQDKLGLVKRWARRCIADEKVQLETLIEFMNKDSELSPLASKVEGLVESKSIAAILQLSQ